MNRGVTILLLAIVSVCCVSGILHTENVIQQNAFTLEQHTDKLADDIALINEIPIATKTMSMDSSLEPKSPVTFALNSTRDSKPEPSFTDDQRSSLLASNLYAALDDTNKNFVKTESIYERNTRLLPCRMGYSFLGMLAGGLIGALYPERYNEIRFLRLTVGVFGGGIIGAIFGGCQCK